ncbi:MAG: ABC transporter permease, partial [Burkholderiales bacterium]|nr:ABC transporter permease [Burkholderiales bacterium]
MKRKLMAVAVAATWIWGGIAQAQISDGVVKIGVLSDMSSLYADIGGPGSVLAARLAVEDFQKTSTAGLKIVVVSADHQN